MGWFNGLFIAECFRETSFSNLKVGNVFYGTIVVNMQLWEKYQISSKSSVPRTILEKVGR